jgi:HEAT repeat protein
LEITREALAKISTRDTTRSDIPARETFHRLRDVRRSAPRDQKVEVTDLVQALSDYDRRKKAQEALVNMGEAAIQPLIQALLIGGSNDISLHAAETLSRIGPSVVDPLIAASKSEDSKARQRAIFAIRDLSKDLDFAKAVDSLIGALGDQDEWTRLYAIQALGTIGDKKAVEPLVQLLAKETVNRNVAGAAAVLAKIADTNGVEVLAHVLQTSDEKGRVRSVADLLARKGDARGVDSLVEILQHSGDESARAEAALTLGDIRDSRGVEPLIRALRDSNSRVRCIAARGLEEIGDSRAIEPLREALKDPDSQVREYAAKALASLGEDQHYLVALEAKLFESTQSPDRSSAAMDLARLGDKGVAVLLRALNSDNPGVYFAAARAINFELMKEDKRLDKGLYESLKPASNYLASIVGRAKVFSGSARPYDEKTSSAIASLNFVGNESAIPTLETLLARIQSMIGTQGEIREYVRTEHAAGFISTKDSVNHVKSAIAAIKSRASLLGH